MIKRKYDEKYFIFLCLCVYYNMFKKVNIFTNVKKLEHRSFYQKYYNKILTRNKQITITLNDCNQIFFNQNFKCNLSGIPIYPNLTASIDRIDNNVGYLKHNIQCLHKDINFIKWKFSQNYFLELCKTIAENIPENEQKNIILLFINAI